ncbi:hypothetical protein TCAL_02975 [Tigriopus californicus]|uniref:Uncharacterized protein n=1 Tax=Tigriopus californicus TaxID=6832 RepID=A0A553PS19_TIGCA|nr:uncharacterized protein LOC131891432 isoform X2 [Tigriopus californicus]TRY80480.1 hypothetical protein TCAL_02975 [Tigriopus californicus]
MGRYDSPGQIGALFLGAALVSMAIISVVRIEALKRYGSSEIMDQTKSPNVGPAEPELASAPLQDDNRPRALRWAQAFTGTMQTFKRRFRSWLDSKNSDGAEDQQASASSGDGVQLLRPKRESTFKDNKDEHVLNTSRLGEELLTEALQGHKIRSIEKKIQKLSPDDQLVQAILRHFPGDRSPSNFPMIRSHSLQEASDVKAIRDQNNNNPRKMSSIMSEDEEGASEAEPSPVSNSSVSSIGDKSHGSPYPDQIGHQNLRHVPSIVCQSYGEVFVTVIVTTTVNIILFVGIQICRNLLWDEKWKSSCWEDDFGFDRLVDPINQSGEPLYIQITDRDRRLSI